MDLDRKAARTGMQAALIGLGALAASWALVAWRMPVLAYAIAVAGMALFAFGAGYAVTGQRSGVLLSTRNRYSFSRAQMLGWTLVVLPGVVVAAGINFFGGPPAQALAIMLPADLLLAMGVALVTTAATPTILAMKSGTEARPGQLATAQARMDPENPGAVKAVGSIVGRTDPAHARLSDMLTGDEVANAGVIDLSKLQNAVLTLILLAIYAGMLIGQFAQAAAPVSALPDLSTTMVQLMALSHAGYLGFKASPKAGPATAATVATAASAGPAARLRAPAAPPPEPVG